LRECKRRVWLTCGGSGETVDDGRRGFGENSDYYKSSNGIFALRWTAPEAMESLKFSAASDVWSFAMVLVEMYQDGELTLPDLVHNVALFCTICRNISKQPLCSSGFTIRKHVERALSDRELKGTFYIEHAIGRQITWHMRVCVKMGSMQAVLLFQT
jgi:hypothetical protein